MILEKQQHHLRKLASAEKFKQIGKISNRSKNKTRYNSSKAPNFFLIFDTKPNILNIF